MMMLPCDLSQRVGPPYAAHIASAVRVDFYVDDAAFFIA